MDMGPQLDSLQVNRCKNNLLPSKKSALKCLRQSTDITIKPADKGSVVVVLSKNYIEEANRHLNEFVYYRKLTVDPTSQYLMEVK